MAPWWPNARAIVTKDVPPYAIVAGMPARIVRYRFSPDVIAALLALQWWDYRLADFGDLDTRDVTGFIRRLEQRIGKGQALPYTPRRVRLAEALFQFIQEEQA